jgi:hypothetical protein
MACFVPTFRPAEETGVFVIPSGVELVTPPTLKIDFTNLYLMMKVALSGANPLMRSDTRRVVMAITLSQPFNVILVSSLTYFTDVLSPIQRKMTFCFAASDELIWKLCGDEKPLQ